MTWSDIPGDDSSEIRLPKWLRKDDPTNAAMIKRDEPAAASVAAGEDLLAAVRAAIENLRCEVIKCAIAECENIVDPDYSRANSAEAELLDEVLLLLARQALRVPVCDPVQVELDGSGLTVEHVPGDRWSAR